MFAARNAFMTGGGPIALGGAVVDADGYRYHIFVGSGTFKVLTSKTMQVVVVGGGGGGAANGGGGGGGRLVTSSGTIAIAYIMRKKKISYKDALALIRKARPCVDPNFKFTMELTNEEKRLAEL